MPQHKSAIKRVRQNKKHRDHNRKLRSKLRTLVTKVMEATDKSDAEEYLKEATAYVDKMSAKGIIHDNNGARKKSKMTKHVNNL